MYGYDDIHENLRFWLKRTITALCSHEARDGVVIYDIGSNDGELTIPWAQPPHRIYAFEPAPAARERLARRLREEKGETALAATQIIPVALGASSGEATLQLYNDDTFSTLHQRPQTDLQQYQLAPAGTVTVPVEPLDALRKERGLPDPQVIKIDVEGAERAVLQGAMETLRQARPALIMEYSCINTGNAGYPREDLLSLLTEAGYRHVYGLYRNRDRNLYTSSALESCRIWNVLALPETLAGVIQGFGPLDRLPPDVPSPATTHPG